MFILCISCITATPHISPTRGCIIYTLHGNHFLLQRQDIFALNSITTVTWTFLLKCKLWYDFPLMTTLLLSPAVPQGFMAPLQRWFQYSCGYYWWCVPLHVMFYARRLYGRTFYNDCGARNALLVHLCGNTPRFFWWWQQGPSMLRESDSCKTSTVAFLHASSCHDRQFYIFISALNPAEAIFVVCLFAISPVACRLFFLPRCEERSEPEW